VLHKEVEPLVTDHEIPAPGRPVVIYLGLSLDLLFSRYRRKQAVCGLLPIKSAQSA